MIRFFQYILQLVLIRKNLDVLMINIIIQENIYIHTHIYSTNHKGKACSGAEKSSKILNGNIVKYQQTALLQQFVVQSLSKIARSCPRLFANPQTAAHQAPLFMGFPRQEYQSCHFLVQRIFPTQGSNPRLLHWQADSIPLSHYNNQRILNAWLQSKEIHY